MQITATMQNHYRVTQRADMEELIIQSVDKDIEQQKSHPLLTRGQVVIAAVILGFLVFLQD
jgi:hypothetical protein